MVTVALPPKQPACRAYSPQIHNTYSYQPSLAAGVIFVVLFSLSASTHIFQTVRYRKAWQTAFILGAFAECLGWIARLGAHFCAYSDIFFEMQISLLIFSPAFTQAGIYYILYLFINILGKKVSPIPAKAYLITIGCLDVICLTVQAIGGGLASSAGGSGKSTEPGTNTMVAGIITQLVSTVVFSVLLGIVLFRGRQRIFENKHLRTLAGATTLSIACMVVRGIYRSIELLQGWRGELITTERYFIALDGVMMVIAVAVFNFANPAKLLKAYEAETGFVGEKGEPLSSPDERDVRLEHPRATEV